MASGKSRQLSPLVANLDQIMSPHQRVLCSVLLHHMCTVEDFFWTDSTDFAVVEFMLVQLNANLEYVRSSADNAVMVQSSIL